VYSILSKKKSTELAEGYIEPSALKTLK
jgi:hypothetical protein